MTRVSTPGASPRRSLWRASVLAIALALAATACGGDDDDGGAGSGTSPSPTDASSPDPEPSPTPLRKVTIASGANPYLLQVWAAEHAGILAEHGLEMEVIQVSSGGGAAIIAAVASGEAQFTTQVLAGAGAAIAGGQPLRFACGTSNTLDRRFEVRPDLDVPDAAEAGFEATVQALEGRTFGVVALGSGNQLDAIGVLTQAGLTEDDVTWVAVGGPATAEGALAAGEVDVVPAYGGLIQQLEANGTGKPVLDYARDVPAFENFFNAGWVTNTSFLESDPDLVEAFCAAVEEGGEWARDPANRDAIIEILEGELGYDENLASQFTDDYFVQNLTGCLDRTAMENALAVAKQQELLEESVTVDQMLAETAVVC